MTIRVPDAPPKRTDRKRCPVCDASAAGCRSSEWLAGRRCCRACLGDHDLAHARETTPDTRNSDPKDAA
jgi:hypothetical protein